MENKNQLSAPSIDTKNDEKIILSDQIYKEMEQDISQFANVPFVAEVLKNGIDLSNFSQQIDSELTEMEIKSTNDYLDQLKNSKFIVEDIRACDSTLSIIEELLKKFHGTLSQLSTDISTLQAKSHDITIKLQNRKNLEENLGTFAKNVTLSQEFINTIVEGNVNEEFMKCLDELHVKLQNIKDKKYSLTNAAQEVSLPLEKLRIKASNNIRVWITDRINEMKTLYGTEQINIQNKMLKHQSLITFIKLNSIEYEQPIRNYYSAVMSRIYVENFKELTKRVTSQMSNGSPVNETIINSNQTGFWKGSNTTGESSSIFVLGDRTKLLNEVSAPPQAFGDGSCYVESLVRSLYQILIDAFTHEFNFTSNYFSNTNVASRIFSETTKFLETYMNGLLDSTNDPVSIVIMIIYIKANIDEMISRNIDKINTHLNLIMNKLKERYNTIMNNNINAAKSVDVIQFHTNSRIMVKKYSELVRSLTFFLSKNIDEIILPNFKTLCETVNTLLIKLSGTERTNEARFSFLNNSYYQIVLFLNSAGGGPFLNDYIAKLERSQIDFVDAVLDTQFPSLFKTVNRAFATSDAGENPIVIDISEKELKDISIDFRDRHVERLKSVIDSLVTRYDDLDNIATISQNIAKRIVFIWARFEQLVKVNSKGGVMPQWWAQMTTPSQLVSNIRPLTKQLTS